jgi:hypothetical protein
VQEKTVCPSTVTGKSNSGHVKQQPKPKHRMTCAECTTNRSRCFTGCDKIDNLIKQSDCVNKCNGAYSCVKGYDCD